MEQAVSQVTKVCLLKLRCICQIRRFIGEEDTKRLVIAFVISRIDYCNSLLKGISHEKIKKLQGIQNQAVKLVKLAHKSDPVTPILKDLRWLPVQSHIDNKILTLVFRSLQDPTFPEYLKQIIETYLPERSLRSKTKNLLKKQRTKLKSLRIDPFTLPFQNCGIACSKIS